MRVAGSLAVVFRPCSHLGLVVVYLSEANFDFRAAKLLALPGLALVMPGLAVALPGMAGVRFTWWTRCNWRVYGGYGTGRKAEKIHRREGRCV